VCTTDTLPVEACGRSPDAGGVEARRQLVVDRESALVPSVVAAEYLAGSRDAEADLAALEAASVIQDFRLDDARAAAELARRLFLRGKFPGWVDVVVGGFAKARGNLPIVTRNTRHFPQNRTRSY